MNDARASQLPTSLMLNDLTTGARSEIAFMSGSIVSTRVQTPSLPPKANPESHAGLTDAEAVGLDGCRPLLSSRAVA